MVVVILGLMTQPPTTAEIKFQKDLWVYLVILIPYVAIQVEHLSRLDLVWDHCLPKSLKTFARTEHRKKLCRHIVAAVAIPSDLQFFFFSVLRVTR